MVCAKCQPGKPCSWHGGKFRTKLQMEKDGHYSRYSYTRTNSNSSESSEASK
jgi:hypothetical protein